jgi:glutathione S-transferase
MTEPILYGAAYSVYSRIARLALAEKGVAHRFEEIDIFDPASVPESYRRRHPFGKIPAFSHGPVELFEACAIARYVDQAFAGVALQPADAAGAARMTQIVGILDSYAYRAMVWDVFVERVRRPAGGETPDEHRIAAGLETAGLCLGVFARFLEASAWLAGPEISLADLHAAPMIGRLRAAPEGAVLVEAHPPVARWWARMAARPAMRATVSTYAPDV